MGIINRITATVTSSVDKAVSHIENHDAVVESALKDTRAALAKSKVRLSRVIKDGENLRKKSAELNQMEQTWTDRAKRIAESDEHKALECIQRRNMCREQAQQLEQSLKRHVELEQNMSDTVLRMEQRLSELTQQRNMMRSRHSTADAMRVINKIEDSSSNGIEDTFDRWEMLITETEYHNGATPTSHIDALDADFTKLENTSELKLELEELLNDKKE